MISYKQFVTEIFDSFFKTEKKAWDKDHAKFSFTDSKNNKFTGTLFRDGYPGHKTLEISFQQDTDHGKRVSVTNNGADALRVYGTIGNEVRNYVKEFPVKEIEFRSLDRKTVPVYSLLARRIAREANGTVETDQYSPRPTFRISLD